MKHFQWWIKALVNIDKGIWENVNCSLLFWAKDVISEDKILSWLNRRALFDPVKFCSCLVWFSSYLKTASSLHQGSLKAQSCNCFEHLTSALPSNELINQRGGDQFIIKNLMKMSREDIKKPGRNFVWWTNSQVLKIDEGR